MSVSLDYEADLAMTISGKKN